MVTSLLTSSDDASVELDGTGSESSVLVDPVVTTIDVALAMLAEGRTEVLAAMHAEGSRVMVVGTVTVVGRLTVVVKLTYEVTGTATDTVAVEVATDVTTDVAVVVTRVIAVVVAADLLAAVPMALVKIGP